MATKHMYKLYCNFIRNVNINVNRVLNGYCFKYTDNIKLNYYDKKNCAFIYRRCLR